MGVVDSVTCECGGCDFTVPVFMKGIVLCCYRCGRMKQIVIVSHKWTFEVPKWKSL